MLLNSFLLFECIYCSCWLKMVAFLVVYTHMHAHILFTYPWHNWSVYTHLMKDSSTSLCAFCAVVVCLCSWSTVRLQHAGRQAVGDMGEAGFCLSGRATAEELAFGSGPSPRDKQAWLMLWSHFCGPAESAQKFPTWATAVALGAGFLFICGYKTHFKRNSEFWKTLKS